MKCQKTNPSASADSINYFFYRKDVIFGREHCRREDMVINNNSTTIYRDVNEIPKNKPICFSRFN